MNGPDAFPSHAGDQTRTVPERPQQTKAYIMEDNSKHPWGEQFPHLTLNQRAFLAAFSEVGTIVRAAESSGIGRASHYQWLTDPVYRRAFEHAKREAADSLEAEARRRAIGGIRKPILYKGEICGWETLYSDSLMVTLLRASDPERFADRTKTDFRASTTYDSPPSSDVTILDVMTPQELADFGKRMRELAGSEASAKVIEAGAEAEEKSSAD
jgi:hypothetical protein